MNFSASLALLCLMVVSATEANPFSKRHDLEKIWKHLKQGSPITHMSVDEVDDLSSALLLRGRPMGRQLQASGSSVGVPFHWESCGPADQLVDVRNLTIWPSPLSFPGEINFGFDIIFQDTISEEASVSADLKLQVNAKGVWIDIPCIGNIGSCHYDSLCAMTKKIQCPADLQAQGIPCSCPFNKGEYKLPKYSVQVDASVFLSGDYRAQAVLTDSVKGQIACYKIEFSVV